MKVLFLDIDGVLNSTMWLKSIAVGERPWPESNIDTDAVKLINQIVQRTGAKVVISSSWRHAHSVAMLRKLFHDCGFEGEIIGATPDYYAVYDDVDEYYRGGEIQAWLLAHVGEGIESFAILDYAEEMGDFLDKFLVRTTYTLGLRVEHVERVVKLLQKERKA